MAKKWCTKLEVALRRCPIVYQGHPSNFKVTQLSKSSNLTQIGRFRTLTQVWIHEYTKGYEMMHKAWSSIEEVLYCFSRSSVKFQGHTAQKIVEFDPNWSFPDCKSSLKSTMATKFCIKLEVAWKRCPIVFQGHTSNCNVTRLKKSSNLTQPNWVFPDCKSSLNSPMATKWCTKLEVE